MWSEHERYKNHFLQLQLKHLQPQQINEMVQKEINKAQNNRKYCNILHFSKSNCKSAFYFEDRANLAYGFWALPKLMKELNCDDHLTQWRAINSFSEYIVNPLYAQNALTSEPLEVVRRCQNLFMRIRYLYPRIKFREKKRFLVILYYFALYRNGAQQLLTHKYLIEKLYQIIYDREVYMDDTSKILPLLSTDTKNCLKLIHKHKCIDKLYDIWNRDHCVSYYPADLWLHLTHIMEYDTEQCFRKGFFEILHKRISGRLFQYHIWDMKCFALLLRCHEGHQRFVQMDGIKFLHTILNDEILDNYEDVVFALMQGLFTKKCLWRCREFTNFPLILTRLAKESFKPEQQLFCLQALREMGVMPVIKRFIKETCFEDIRNLKCERECNEKERQEIVYWLEREIYHTSNLRNEMLNIN